jgi:hypothetical protein
VLNTVLRSYCMQGRTLLMWAAATGNVEIMNMLIHQVTKVALLLAV